MTKPKLNYGEGNRLYIIGEFNYEMQNEVLPLMDKAIFDQSNKRDGVIIFDIDSNGGYTSVLFSILSKIAEAKNNKIKIITNVIGRAHSCGSVLAIQGDERNIYEHANHLVHSGSHWGVEARNIIEGERSEKARKHHFSCIKKCYLANSNEKFKKIIDEVLRDNNYFLTAEESIKYGLADNII